MNNNFSKPNKRYKQGYYIATNKDKYIGNPSKIFYRSSWELAFCDFCNSSPNVKKWGLETVTIPYQDIHGKVRRYIPDFYCEITFPNQPGRLDRLVIEIKPKEEVTPKFLTKEGNLIPPAIYLKGKSFKATQNYEYALKTYQKNLSKWTKSKIFCKNNGMQFMIMTKEDLQKFKIMR